MRRFIVICLIFLFPLQVFADSADYPPMHIVAPDSISQVHFESKLDSGGVASFIAKVCSEDNFDQPPAHLDLTDVLFEEWVSELEDEIKAITPPFLTLQHYVLFLPLSKPPPRANS